MRRPRPPRVVVASDSFKGSRTSTQVGTAVRAGILDAVPDAEVVVVPVADGGEGTLAAALASGFEPLPATVHGPTGELVDTVVAVRAADRTVVVEMADACGLGRLPGGVLRPLETSSRGLGDAIRAALAVRPRTLVVAVGGSASTDGGAGMLSALGARIVGRGGEQLPDGGAALARVTAVDLTTIDPRLRDVDVVLAADVDSPLLGPRGAAAVFGPQKGATPDAVSVLEDALAHWASVVAPEGAGRPGAGAAGGVGFALLAVVGARRRPGVDLVLDLVGLDAVVSGADLVVTGEGSLDAQTAAGKAVAGVARRGAAAGVPVVAVCGRTSLRAKDIHSLGLESAYSLGDLEPDVSRSMTDADALLRHTGARIARERLSRPV